MTPVHGLSAHWQKVSLGNLTTRPSPHKIQTPGIFLAAEDVLLRRRLEAESLARLAGSITFYRRFIVHYRFETFLQYSMSFYWLLRRS